MVVIPDRFDLASTAGTEGTLFRGERVAPDGRLVDATPWSPRPVEAIRALHRLELGLDRDDQPWTTAA